MRNCQNYGPFLGPYYNTGPNTGPNLGDPKRDHNFDNPPCGKQGWRFSGVWLPACVGGGRGGGARSGLHIGILYREIRPNNGESNVKTNEHKSKLYRV